MTRLGTRRLAVQVLIIVSVIWWLLYWFLLPIKSSRRWLHTIDRKVNSRFLGTSGSIFMLQAVPVMIIAVLSYVMVWLQRKTKPSQRTARDSKAKPHLNIWTLPIFLRSPLGMLTIGDLTFILVTFFIVCWYLIKSSVDDTREIDRNPVIPGDPSRWVSKFMVVGKHLGIASLIPFALLWIPVSRGSPLLRVIGVPFEHVIRHHIWLGSLTVWLAASHTAFLLFYLIHERRITDILSWHTRHNACIPGMIALASGILMLVTALGVVRRRFFDLFFRVHHLYLAYLVFFAFHAVYDMYILIVPVMLFFLDRFIRMVQSRKTVDVLSAKVLPSGAMELRFKKPEKLTYHALSFVYLRLPSVSCLQWHPFSVASSPLDGTNEIAIFIKPLGRFTRKLHDVLITSTLMTSKQCQSRDQGRPVLFSCPFSFKVALEGPYGDESLFYLRYQTLVMVAGGIGVTPFLAMIRDILHRYRMLQDGLPSTIHLIFCVRQSYELDILDTLSPSSILPGYEEFVNIKIHAYVTSTENVDGDNIMAPMDSSIFISINDARRLMLKGKATTDEIRKVSAITSTGSIFWVGASVTAVLVGFFVIWGIFNVEVLTSNSHNYTQVLFYILSVFLAVVFFGGAVMLVWAGSVQFDTKRSFRRSVSRRMAQVSTAISPVQDPADVENIIDHSAVMEPSTWQGELVTGRRPNWKEIFDRMALDCDGQDVGVVVSGPPLMQMDVAKECKHHSLSKDSMVMMNYHSVSFEF